VTATLADVLNAAAIGAVAEGVLIPLSAQGKLRVTYNWLYSALNCDRGDNSDFIWVLTKRDQQHVVLSPRDGYAGKTLYASVRDDWSWFVQVQAPHSADWITGVGQDEIMAVEGLDLLTLSLRGWNGQYVTVNSASSDHDGHSGCRLQSLTGGDKNARTFFLGVTRLCQPGLDLPLRSALTPQAIESILGPAADAARPEFLHALLS
jgi:hypothetical protein